MICGRSSLFFILPLLRQAGSEYLRSPRGASARTPAPSAFATTVPDRSSAVPAIPGKRTPASTGRSPEPGSRCTSRRPCKVFPASGCGPPPRCARLRRCPLLRRSGNPLPAVRFPRPPTQRPRCPASRSRSGNRRGKPRPGVLRRGLGKRSLWCSGPGHTRTAGPSLSQRSHP